VGGGYDNKAGVVLYTGKKGEGEGVRGWGVGPLLLGFDGWCLSPFFTPHFLFSFIRWSAASSRDANSCVGLIFFSFCSCLYTFLEAREREHKDDEGRRKRRGCRLYTTQVWCAPGGMAAGVAGHRRSTC
jgi:hypothetical protein